MGGWKTWAGAAALGIPAIIQLVIMVIDALLYGEPVNMDLFNSNLMQIGAAIGLVGVGHKIEKSRK